MRKLVVVAILLVTGLVSAPAHSQQSKPVTTKSGGHDKQIIMWKNSSTRPQPSGEVTSAGDSSISQDPSGNVSIPGNNVGVRTKASPNASLSVSATATTQGISVKTQNGNAVVATSSGQGIGLQGTSQSGTAVSGATSSSNNPAVLGTANSSVGGVGVRGTVGGVGHGVEGESDPQKGVGVYGKSASGHGVEGEADNQLGVGVYGSSHFGRGVVGTRGTGASSLPELSSLGAGVYGSNDSGPGVEGVGGKGGGDLPAGEEKAGVFGTSDSAPGVFGISKSGRGVEGKSTDKGGVVGESDNGNGVSGVTKSQTAAGIYGEGHRAGVFKGSVAIEGNFLVDGKVVVQELLSKLKSFQIDDPLDPTNKYLRHASVESSEMMNMYSGNITLDAHGQATVELPAWFEALNKDFRYQLTPIGAPGPKLYIAEKVNHNHFRIAGGRPGMEVSWQVTAVRHDPWAAAHPLQVEEEKTGAARGAYLHPSAYDQPIEKSIDWAENPYFHEELKAIWERDHQQVQFAEGGQPTDGDSLTAKPSAQSAIDQR